MFSTSRISGIADLPPPVAVCCHDAGGANLVAAWVSAEPGQHYRLCVGGPARAIFAAIAPQLVPLSLAAALDGAGCLLSGSGWSSDLEHDARLAARDLALPVLAVLDHWANYRMRFVRRDVETLPDAFVVADAEAASLAREVFGDSRPIRVWPNHYLENEAARVRAISARVPATPPANLLVLLEPVRENWGGSGAEPAEFRALDFLMQNLDALAPPQMLALRLRPHPSEAPAKYEPWLRCQSHPHLEISSDASLAADLAWADAVAGLQSYALVVALAARRRAVSYLPPDAPPCSLRHPGIEHLFALKRAVS